MPKLITAYFYRRNAETVINSRRRAPDVLLYTNRTLMKGTPDVLVYTNRSLKRSQYQHLWSLRDNCSERQAKIWQHQLGVRSYFDYSQLEGKGQSIGIIIDAKYDIFVHKAFGHKGRIIYLDLYFSDKRKLHLIQVYLNANQKERLQIEALHKYIDDTISDAQSRDMEVIIMGDFNINYRKYLMAFVNNKWQFSLFRTLESDPNKQESRLDYIWAFLPMLEKSINSTVKENDHFDTDHKTVTLSLDTVQMTGISLNATNQKKKHIKRTVFQYDEMDKDDKYTWENFSTQLDLEIENTLMKDFSIIKPRHINTLWDMFRQVLMRVAKSRIVNKQVIRNKVKTTPEKKLSIYFDLRYIINRILETRSILNDTASITYSVAAKWSKFQHLINMTLDKYECSDLSSSFNFLILDNFKLFLKNLCKIRKYLRLLFKLELDIMVQEQIVSNIKKRCTNFKDNQASMIRSIMEKEMVYISIEKIYKKDARGNESLITGKSAVLQETNHHFQTIAGSINRKKPLQGRWKDQYQPLRHINENIYSKLMDLPSRDEWLDVIRNLPKGKATGPSGIFNEMLQHLSPTAHDVLYYLICKIIQFGYLPKQWKKATVFPIAKPKPFNCELSNSCLITLLETARKALITLLNRHLTSTLKQHNILQTNQFAGLPKQSTFEPIRIVNEIIQDAIDNNNELWILSQDMGKAYDRVNTFQLKKAMDRIKLPQQFTHLILDLFKDRTNQVITIYGKTTAYDVLTGIDQGEVISPVLWCIYYDSLLAEINKQNLGYMVSYYNIQQVLQLNSAVIEQHVLALAFMDDTQWITDKKDKLVSMLSIANSFYRLNNIQINKEKSELMMRTKIYKRRYSHIYNNKINIQFGRESISIKEKHPHKPTRILGVYFNIENDEQYLISKVKAEIDHLTNLM
ncbi:hypothetical protein RclHR1_02550001 [Rhizophagus clarus]|uniref:Reverse transcriptase domain-containing protein n=1 Tax=Rhizophagus clarus TaxID=94130 RepID=A0A2Z6RCZ1_9GLOM|nr:hypothetical protein RclHR1_02550001 [Rhizophagus clarus]